MKHIRTERWEKHDRVNEHRARLLISCPDKPGIVAAVSDLLYMQGANIIESSQYTTDPTGGQFFLRIEFESAYMDQFLSVFETKMNDAATKFQMDWRLSRASQRKNMVIFASKGSHCLLELLWRWQAGDLLVNIPMVISNHEDLRESVEMLGIPFHHIPVTKDTKKEAEAKQLELVGNQADLIVLARYMQILSPEFVVTHPHSIINIHHSFLPAFVGAHPYERAYDRGVKLIGATSHYVTDELDEGPIIEQDVARVDHKDDVEDLKRIGRTIERNVLARAVTWHVEDRVIVHGNKTVVFQ
ncbi:formyltetrahydrofolate deformylase [Aureibacillus halotolerans]|uniref:Formyltetrahydrofolate deformylase n=1 Tax=Aureibacillus halotolerans TaxID=1508390 RepID=A0A4R6TVC9_9BACI|nr:formyltetrahydrofolate deformylase [Aureibacillus halotolerans]TDQ35400.1 formyltetrahydrofolate deformylase [Aureibacillus halotolerans]